MKFAKLLQLFVIICAFNNLLSAQSAPNLENGFKPYGSYDGSSIDTVNLQNGNLMLHLPAYPEEPQRGKMNLNHILYLTAKNWVHRCPPVPCVPTLQLAGINFQPTWGAYARRTINIDSTSGQTVYSAANYSIVTSDGATHQVYPVPGTADSSGQYTQYRSIDGVPFNMQLSNPDPVSGLLNTVVITNRSGTQHLGTFSGGKCTARPQSPFMSSDSATAMIDNYPLENGQTCSEGSGLNQMTDSNGNNIIPSGIDTVGRIASPLTQLQTTNDPTGCPTSLPFATAWLVTYIGASGEPYNLKLCYGTVSYTTTFLTNGIIDVSGGGQVLTAFIRADGSQWTFTYDNFLNPTSVTLPTGGSISYVWDTHDFMGTGTSTSRVVKSRTVTDNRGNTYTWNYQWGTLSNRSFTNVSTDPLNNDTVHVFTYLAGGGGEGYFETSTVSYQGGQSAGQLLKRVDTTYGIATTISNHLANAYPTRVQTTVYPSGKVSLITKDYDPGPGSGGSSFGGVIAEKEFDWGQGSAGPLLRETDTTYQWQVNSAYLAAQLLDLPASVVVRDGGGCALSETDYSYDESTYLTQYESTVGALPQGSHIAPPAAVRGNLTSVTKWLAATSSCNPKGGTAVTSHTNWYDTGEVYQQIDPLGHKTTYSYDPVYKGALVTQTCSPATNGGSVAHCVSGTYSLDTGLLKNLTNENATTQASGNTAGDAAHTSSYTYDSMLRVTSATAPPDPANGGLSAQTSFNPSPPNTFPLSVQRTKSITASLTDSTTSFFDGLGRVYESQHILPGGTATVDTTFDFAGHPTTVSNPYFSTADPTYGTVGTLFDALGRAYSITKQDGSVSSVAYNVITGMHDAVIGANTVGDCTDTADEAGKQRRACTDALGRLVQVVEPNPGASASNASGSVTVNGNEQASTQSGFPATGQVTITTLTNGEQVTIVCTSRCISNWDTGNVNISVNGYPKTAAYGQGSTTSTVAAALRDAFHNDALSPVDASCADQPCTNPVITFTARTVGVATDYSLACSTTNNHFSPGSFTPSCPSALAGGQNPITTPDSGSVTITVNGTNYSTTYGGGDTTATIAQRLAGVISAGTLANASASGSTVTITTKTGGNGTNYSLAASYVWNNASFINPSFTTTTSGSVLTGGYDAGVLDNQPYVTLYQYDGLGNLLRVDQKGTAPSDSTKWRSRTFAYDSLSRLVTATNPESGTITYSYDLDGNLLQKTSPAPNQTGTATQVVSYCYDELHRVLGKGYGAQTCPLATPVVTYAYDSGANAIGKLTSLTDQAGTASYTYDILGRLAAETRTLTGANNAVILKNLSYEYNLDGSLYKLHYPSGSVVTYEPGAAGLTLSAKDTGNNINYVTSATYGPDSALTGFISGYSTSFAGITNAFVYNNRLQPCRMTASSTGAVPTSCLNSWGNLLDLNYDFHLGNGDNGNVFGITNYRDQTRNQTFTYDALNRLASARNAGTDCSVTVLGGLKKFWGNTYTYDAWGNLLTKALLQTPAPAACAGENLSFTADAHNWIHATGGSDYQYDAAGNMTFNATPPTQTYTYDQENRLTGAAGYAYTYDGDGNRVRKSNSSTGTLYWYMTPGIVGESDLSGNLTDEYVFFDGERVARKSTNGIFYYFSDHLKTASVITDASGNIKSESDFYPWGGELPFVANDSNHYKFTGKERDGETQLDYFGARYYSNGLGRWISADWSPTPIPVPYADFNNPQSLNLYGFVGGNPVSKADPDGHCDPISCVMHAIEYLSGHAGYVGTVEGNVRSNYNARIQETKASQGGQITSEQRTAIQQEARQGSTALGRSVAEAHDANTAATKAAKAAAGTLEESAGRTNLGFNTVGKVAKVAGPALTAVAVGIAAKNVADAPSGQKLQTAASEGTGLAGAIAGGELGAELGAPAGPWGALGLGIAGSIAGGVGGKSAMDHLVTSLQPAADSGYACAKGGMCGQK